MPSDASQRTIREINSLVKPQLDRMLPTSIVSFEKIISKPRLDSYRHYFHVSTAEAIGLYMWNCEISACFNALLAFFEIAMRNNIHGAMSRQYGPASSSSVHWYDVIWSSLKSETKNKIKAERRVRPKDPTSPLRVPPPNPDEIVSKLMFGFWPTILTTVPVARAASIFPDIFPHHPMNANPMNWSVHALRKPEIAYFYELNAFRNRIAHHEPLWKFGDIVDTSGASPIVLVPASTDRASSMQRFERVLGFIIDGIATMNQAFHADLIASSWLLRLEFLLSHRGFERYRTLKHCPIATHTPTDFRRKYRFIEADNQPVRISRKFNNTAVSGTFIPD